MSKKSTPTAPAAAPKAPPPPRPVPQPLGTWQDTLPIYALEDERDIKLLRDSGVQYALLLGNEKVPVKGSETTYTNQPALFRMMSMKFGYSIRKIPFSTLGWNASITSSASMTLPKIPWSVMGNIIKVFREVFRVHGTECTVMLTYDRTFLDEADPGLGWGFFVPNQTNTPHDSKYQMGEIHEHIEELGHHIFLAGSSHSHPEMSAFNSHTDDEDQAKFEGLHITVGWDKGSLANEFAVQMTLNGAPWTYDPEDVIDIPVPVIPDFDGAADAVKKVTKQAPIISGWGGGGGSTPKSGRSYVNNGPSPKGAVLHLPDDIPNLTENIVLTLLRPDEANCRFCDVPITSRMLAHHRCYNCSSYVLGANEELKDLIDARTALNLKVDPDLNVEKGTKPLWVWSLTPRGDGKGYDNHFESLAEDKQTVKK